MFRMFFAGLAVAVLGVCPATVHALGSDYSKEDLKTHGVFAGQTPVHGYWVNWEDQFYYGGDTKVFNAFAEAYAKFRHVELKVVIHAGKTNARSPWDEEPRAIPADWSLYVWNTGAGLNGDLAPQGKPAPTRLDVWVGGNVRLEDVRIPSPVTVEAAADVPADSPIQAYLREHRKAK